MYHYLEMTVSLMLSVCSKHLTGRPTPSTKQRVRRRLRARASRYRQHKDTFIDTKRWLWHIHVSQIVDGKGIGKAPD